MGRSNRAEVIGGSERGAEEELSEMTGTRVSRMRKECAKGSSQTSGMRGCEDRADRKRGGSEGAELGREGAGYLAVVGMRDSRCLGGEGCAKARILARSEAKGKRG